MGRSSGEGKAYPLQYSSLENTHKESETTKQVSLSLWASLIAQLVKNLPGVQGTQVQSLGWEDPLEKEKEMATHTSILAWKILWTEEEEPGGLQSMRSQELGTS